MSNYDTNVFSHDMPGIVVSAPLAECDRAHIAQGSPIDLGNGNFLVPRPDTLSVIGSHVLSMRAGYEDIEDMAQGVEPQVVSICVVYPGVIANVIRRATGGQAKARINITFTGRQVDQGPEKNWGT